MLRHIPFDNDEPAAAVSSFTSRAEGQIVSRRSKGHSGQYVSFRRRERRRQLVNLNLSRLSRQRESGEFPVFDSYGIDSAKDRWSNYRKAYVSTV